MKDMKHTMIPSLLAGAALFTAQAEQPSSSPTTSLAQAAEPAFRTTGARARSPAMKSPSHPPPRSVPLTSNITTSTADFWFVSNLTITGTSSGWDDSSFYDGGTEDMFSGSDGATTTWEFDTTAISDQTSTVPNFTGVETLLIAHVTSTSIDMSDRDPTDTSSAAALGTADKAITVNPITNRAQWTQLRIGTSRTVAVNDMTAATTFGEAIPEPSVALLAQLLAPVMLLRRRRS